MESRPAPEDPRPPTPDPSGRRAAPRREWVLLALLCGAVALYWALQYTTFHFPNNDYYSFRNEARDLAAGQLPGNLKRAPLLPAAMALLAPLMPEPHALLHAARVLNMACSLGLLVAVFALASRLLGAGAIAVAVLLAANPHFHAMAQDGLVEPSLGLFVVLAFLALEAGSRWRYAAAAAAALSRTDVGVLVPVLVASDWWRERRFWPPVWRGALAVLPLVAWTALGWWRDSGAASYMDLMAGMGWNKATEFLLTAWKEPFYGWYDDPGATPRFALFLAAVVAPVAVGAAAGLRRAPQVMAPLLAFAVLSVGAIVGFGISKARYVYPSQWILLLLWVWGVRRAATWGLRALGPRIPAAAASGAAVLAAAAGVALQADALGPFLAEPRVTPLALELGFGAVLVAILAVGLFDVFGRRGRLGLAAGLAALALAGPIVTGSLQRKIRIQTKSYYGNYSAVVASRWLAANLGPGERALTQHASQIRFLGELPRDRVSSYSGMDAADLPALRAEMRERGLTHALYTWRKPVQTPSDAYYYRRLRSDLADLFKDGGPVEGFAHVATLPLPDALERDPVQVYRLLPPDPGAASDR